MLISISLLQAMDQATWELKLILCMKKVNDWKNIYKQKGIAYNTDDREASDIDEASKLWFNRM